MSSGNVDSIMIERRSGLIEAEVDGELVALHVENGKCYGFNGTATRIWALVEQPMSLAELCACLSKDYEMDAGPAAAEVLDFLRELEADGLVKLSSSAGVLG